MRQGNVQTFSEAQTLQRVRDLVKLALVADQQTADQQTRVLLMREVQSLIEARGRANAATPTSTTGAMTYILQRNDLIPAIIARMLVCNPDSQNRRRPGGLMQTVLLCLAGWIAANLIIAAVWTVCCLWPRRRGADALMESAFRRAL